MKKRQNYISYLPLAALVVGALMPINTSNASAENVSFSLSLDYNSHFFSYGANVWDGPNQNRDTFDGFLFQPSAELNFALTEGSGIYTGVWFDINNNVNSTIGGRIQEVDVWLGYYFTFESFVTSFTLNQWFYAGDNEGTFDVKIAYTGIPITPYVLAHYRFDPNGNQETGTMFEVGATLYETEVGAVSLSFPINVGFTFDDYHVANEDGYVYSSISANFGMPLAFISESYGDWGFHGGLTVYHTDKAATGNARSSYVALNLGVGLSF